MTRTFAATLTAVLLCTAPTWAQEDAAPDMTPEQMAEMEAYMTAGTPGEAHEALAMTAGSYELTVRSWNDPAGEPMESSGTATRTMALDGRVLVEDVSSSMMGMPYTGHGMTGYDNVTGKYWSTWNDSMSTSIMVSEGTCDDDHVCTFTGSWNDPITGGLITSRMTSRWTSETTELFEMFGPGKDGEEVKMMEIEYRKQ
ncbi:MAG: DUF1579 domain-containing protein [Thermoanaerobaculia bacterium]|nr:DUF1579 domain-containing protein [Thermoanaerobaculia bacterium]